MDEEALLHRISVDANVNIEFLKDLIHDEKMWTKLRAGKINDATIYIRTRQPRIGLRECQLIAQAFAATLK